jgi:LysR family transcriptional regulator for bpeEF and oprC
MRITIQAMSIFVRAVETNSFTSAARSLLMDPTGVSRAIKALETELGIPLFVRSTRTLKLTAEGARFYRDCVQILKKVEEATEKFRNDQTVPRGLLKIGMAPGLTRRMILRAMPAFQQKYPEIEIVLLNVDDIAMVGDKGIDVLIRGRGLRQRGGQRPEPQGVVVRKLAQLQYVACASPEYLGRAGAPRTPADLFRHACIATMTLERDIRDEWQFVKAQVRQKVKLDTKLLVHGADATREAGVAGCGIIRLGAGHVEDELHARKLVAVLPDWECVGAPPIVAIYRKTRPLVPQVNVFIRHLVEAFQRYNDYRK